MNTVFLLLGSNEGDRLAQIDEAIRKISSSCGTVVHRSALYQTAAWGLEEQPDFINGAICVQTSLTANELLDEIRTIETDQGRQRTVKWGQRTLDIDILFFNQEVINSPDLTVPHPRLPERRFALVPLNEIAADYVHPVLRKPVSELLLECPDTLEVSRFES